MIERKHCLGCRDDYYNGANAPSGCWSRDSAKLKTRFRLSIHTPCSQKSGYQRMKVPDCKRQQGYVFFDRIPENAR